MVGIKTVQGPGAAAVEYPKAEGYNALINDVWLRTAADPNNPIHYYTRDSLAERSDDRGSTYENVLDIGYAFARTDISGGEGLDWDPRLISQLDDATDRDQIRFWDSSNIDTRRPAKGELYQWRLAKATEDWNTFTDLKDLATSDDLIFVAYGTTVEWWQSWSDSSPTGTASVSSAIAAIVASPAGEVVALLANGTLEFKKAGSPTFTPIPGVMNANGVWWAKGRFIVATYLAEVTNLYEGDENGVGQPFNTFRGVCHDVVSSGPAIVAACSDGLLRSYVAEQANQNDPDSVNLVIRGQTEVPESEIPYELGSNSSVLLVLTKASSNDPNPIVRVYQGAVLDSRYDYIVGNLQLLREWDDTQEVIDIRKNMVNTRDEIWFIINEEGNLATWRYDLVTQGLNRHRLEAQSGSLAFVIFDDIEGHVFGTTVKYSPGTNYMPSGYVIMPNINFGLNTEINWLALVLISARLTAATPQIEVYYTTNSDAILDDQHPDWLPFFQVVSEGQEVRERQFNKVSSQSLSIMVRMYATVNGTSTPAVERIGLRGIPGHRDWILDLPINVSDYVEVPFRYPTRVPGLGDLIHRHVVQLAGKSVAVQVLDPPFVFRGVIDAISEPTMYVSDRGSASVRATVRCRGELISSGDEGVGLAGLGVPVLGTPTQGVEG